MPEFAGTRVDRSARRAVLGWLLVLLVAAGALWAYVRTAAASIYWGDSAEFQRVAYSLEVPHPSGYPLYLLLSHAWTLILPVVGHPAWKVNIFSAFTAALSVGVVTRTLLVLTGRLVPSILGGMMLGTSACFWFQAIVAEVYSLHVLLISLLILALADSAASWNNRWFTVPLLVGLASSHHRMAVLLCPGLAFLMVCGWRDGVLCPRRQDILAVGAAALLSLAPYAFLYRAYDWPTVGHFVAFVGSGGSFFSIEGFREQFESEVLPLVLQQLGVFGLTVMALGASRILGPEGWRAHLGHFLAITWCVSVAFLATLRVADLYSLFPHLQLFGALLFGLGVAKFLSFIERFASARLAHTGVVVLCMLLLGALIDQGVGSYQANDLSDDNVAERRSRQVLQDLSPGSVIVAGWIMGQPLLAQQALQRLRVDVTIDLSDKRNVRRLGELLHREQDVYLWGGGWKSLVAVVGGFLEPVRDGLHGAPLYPHDSCESFDRRFCFALAANHDLHRLRVHPRVGQVPLSRRQVRINRYRLDRLRRHPALYARVISGRLTIGEAMEQARSRASGVPEG